jgi:peroxiredoxin
METTKETTKQTEIGTAEEILDIPLENKGKSYSVLKVCSHNIVPSILPLLDTPVCLHPNIYNNQPILNISVAKTP